MVSCSLFFKITHLSHIFCSFVVLNFHGFGRQTQRKPTNTVDLSTFTNFLLNLTVMQTLSIELQHCTFSEIKTHVTNILGCLSIICADQKQHSNWFFLTKFDSDTLQTCVNIANEDLQA